MITESVARTVLKFFFLAELDEDRALSLAKRAIDLLRKEQQKGVPGQIEAELVWRAIREVWLKKHELKSSSQSIGFSFADWRVPKSIELGPWLDFRRKADSEEFFAVLSVNVMGFSADEIARYCGMPKGSLRHRLNRGLRVLGDSRAEGAR